MSTSMKKYLGIKLVHAEPCTNGEAEDYLNRQIQGEREDPGYLVVYPDGYESWCPKEQFEKHNMLAGVEPSSAEILEKYRSIVE